MAEKKYLSFVELYKKACPTATKQKQYERAQALWKTVKGNSHLYESKVLELKKKLQKLTHQSWPIGKKQSLLYQQKWKKRKKESESSNTLQSDGNKQICSKKTFEVITVNGKKIPYTMNAIIPLVNLRRNLSKFLTKTHFWETIQAGLSIDWILFPNSVFWIFINVRLCLKMENKCSFVTWEVT